MNREEILSYFDCKIVECYLLKDSDRKLAAKTQGEWYQYVRLAIFGKELGQDKIDLAIVDAERCTAALENEERQNAEVARIRGQLGAYSGSGNEDDNDEDTTPETT